MTRPPSPAFSTRSVPQVEMEIRPQKQALGTVDHPANPESGEGEHIIVGFGFAWQGASRWSGRHQTSDATHLLVLWLPPTAVSQLRGQRSSIPFSRKSSDQGGDAVRTRLTPSSRNIRVLKFHQDCRPFSELRNTACPSWLARSYISAVRTLHANPIPNLEQMFTVRRDATYPAFVAGNSGTKEIQSS